MILRSGGWLVAVAALAVGSVGPVWAQTPAPAAPAPPAAPKEEKLTEQKEGEKQKTLWDEFKLFSFIEMGATFNLNGGSKGVPGATSDGWTNTLRQYDIDQGYTFNMAELSIKRDPDEAFPFGMGLVLTAGQDAQKNHSIGILRDDNDAFPFRNTSWLNDDNRKETLEFLEAYDLPFVCVDMPQGFKSSVPPIVAATSNDLAVMRFHGHNADEWESGSVQRRFAYLYSEKELKKWVPKLEQLAADAAETHVLMNNCHSDYAQRNGQQLAALLEAAGDSVR